MHKLNIDKVKQIVKDKRFVCGMYLCQVCDGWLWYEVDTGGSIDGQCSNPNCVDYNEDFKSKVKDENQKDCKIF